MTHSPLTVPNSKIRKKLQGLAVKKSLFHAALEVFIVFQSQIAGEHSRLLTFIYFIILMMLITNSRHILELVVCRKKAMTNENGSHPLEWCVLLDFHAWNHDLIMYPLPHIVLGLYKNTYLASISFAFQYKTKLGPDPV